MMLSINYSLLNWEQKFQLEKVWEMLYKPHHSLCYPSTLLATVAK